MNKKILFFFAILCSFGGTYFLLSQNHTFASSGCAFCNPEILERQTFYQDGTVAALYTHKPLFPGHCLIIPLRHVERFEQLSDEEILRIGQVTKKVHAAVMKVFGTSPYLLLEKNGTEVGQTVPHLHFHYMPRKQGDSSILKILFRMYLNGIQQPISTFEMKEVTTKLREAIENEEECENRNEIYGFEFSSCCSQYFKTA